MAQGALRPEPDSGLQRSALQLEGSGRVRFTLDEEDDDAEVQDELPLLSGSSGAGATGSAASAGESSKRGVQRTVSRYTLAVEEEVDSWAQYRHEAGRIVGLALPLTISQFFTFALGLIAMLFVGRLGEQELAIAVLATSLMNVTGFSLVLGLLGALDTLCGQAWGAKNYPALGVNLQKAIVTTLATAAGICLLWAHAGGLMAAAGQEPAVAAGAARFLLLCTPALFCAGLFECLKRYLMAQGVVAPVTGVSLAAVLLAPPFNWALIFKAGLGLDGAAAAMVATWVTMLCMLGAYVAWHERRRRGTPQQTWHGWSRDCLKGLGAYYRLAVPFTLMVCLEWWAYEFTIFLAGWLPQPTLHVAAMGVMLQVSGFCYMLPMGLSCATSVRVSNALGAGLPHAARRSAHTATAITALTQASLAAALVLGRNVWGAVFTDLPEVIAACAAAFPVMAGSMFGDGMNATIGGVLRGAGRQELGALLNLASYWGVGLPTAYLLAHGLGMGLRGLWAGLVTCTSLQGVVMLAVLARFRWRAEAERALAASGAGTGGSGCHGGSNGAEGLASCEDSAAKLSFDRAAGGADSRSASADAV